MASPDPVAAAGPTRPGPPPRPAGQLPPVPLPQAVKLWRDSAVAWLRPDDPDAAGVLAARRAPDQVPRLVVVGETNRGKSSLVNALLGTRGLSPVDAGTATSSYLVFAHAPAPYAVARFSGGLADVTFPPAELRNWATADGDPDVDLPPPRWIEVGVSAALAERLTVVDTPGVGGLVAAHAELAGEAAAAATALLFVVDASAPFTRGELDFLESVSNRVDTVHFAVTKTDAYRGWREIVAADRLLLARHAPRFTDAPFHPVSSRLAEVAGEQTDPRIVDVLREQSGVDQLRSALTAEVVSTAALLADANIIRTAIGVLVGDAERLARSRSALTAGADASDQLKARREELLNRRKNGGRSFQIGLRAEIQRARVELAGETSREVREASQMFRTSIDTAGNDELKKMPFHINAYAQAMTQRAHGRLQEAMARICRATLAELFTPGELRILVGRLATRPYVSMTDRTLERARSLDESIMTLGGASMGFSLSHMMLSLPAIALPAMLGAAIVTPVAAVVGGAAAVFMVRSRKRVANRQQLKQWLNEVLVEAKAQIDQSVAEQFVDVDAQLTLALDDALAKQVAALENDIREVDGALKLDATDRASRLRVIDERRAAATAIVAAGETLLRRIRGTRMASNAPPVLSPALAAALAPAAPPPPQAGVRPPPAPPPPSAPPATASSAAPSAQARPGAPLPQMNLGAILASLGVTGSAAPATTEAPGGEPATRGRHAAPDPDGAAAD